MRDRLHVVFLPALAVLLAAGIWISDALLQGENALISRRYGDAVTALTTALAEEPVERHDRILLLLARAQYLAGEPGAAVATYERIGRDHPDSRLVDKAALQRAETLASTRRFREAAAVYREQIERLTGPDRKEMVAETYLGLADKALVGDSPDPRRAVTFYDLALDLGLGELRARNVRLLAAEALLRAGDPRAVARLEPLVGELGIGGGKLRAMLALGRARSSAGDAPGARTALRDLIALAPDSAEAADAAYEVARTFGVPEPGPARLDRAIAALRTFAASYPAHPRAPVAEYLIARCYLSVGRSEEGLAALRSFLDASADQALEEIATAGAAVGFVLFEQGRIDDAIDAWRGYLKAHPAHADWERVQRAIVDAELARAAGAERDERWEATRTLLEQFGRDHPLDERNPDVLLRIGESYTHEQRWDDARAALERCVRKYPGRDESSRAQYRIGEIYEDETFDYQRALDAYKAVTWGRWQATAQSRIARLERKGMHLRTERSFRSGEAAGFRITSRNVPEVRVRVYRLDLETWFRATHLPDSVERLDIEVIAPDATFQSPVPDYVPFRETERDVVVGFDEPGCYVVKVDDQELEATTMVLVTDLGMIVKSSRKELFVFTQDLKEDRVHGGVRVVVSDGEKVLHEGLTDDSGVLSWRDDALRNVAELRVFAVDASGSGAGTLDLSGLGYTEGLTPKVYLFSDRPAYRPGDAVHLKGIVRDVRAGLFTLPRDAERPRFRVVSPSGRAMLDQQVAYTDFGTFAGDLVLPDGAETGTWRIELARGADGRDVTTATFDVARFELPRVMISAEPKQKVVYRGEPIEGSIRLRHFYGEPVVGREVLVVMRRPDGTRAEKTAATNAEGVVEFAFETTEFAEEAVALVQATVAEDGVATSVAIPVVTTEFEPRVTMLRDVQIAGRPFEATLRIVDRSGAPLAKAGELVLVRREPNARGIAEVEVARAAFRTAGADGTARVTLTAPKGGQHVLRAQATDRFGQLVTADLALTVSGEDDTVKLRILADRQSLEVGDLLEVTVVNRAVERLALRTIQADGVLAHAAVRIPTGESTFRLPLTGEHAPNIGLAFAMIDGNQLHTAEQDFLVARDLDVELRPKTPTAAPGAEVELEVIARDAAGRPVVAELALAMVDRSVFELFADPTPEIGQFFWGGRRETAFRTASSCSWSYDGPSRQVSRALVEEERRRNEEAGRADRADDGAEDARASAFDSNAWNSAVGLGGGAGGGIGGRRGGRTPGPVGPSTPGPAGPATGGPGGPAQGPVTGGQIAFDLQAGTSTQQLADDSIAPGLEFEDLQRDFAGLQLFKQANVAFGFALDEALNSASDQPRALFAPDGVWLSSVRTGADGRATVRLRMPISSGEWQLTGRGVTAASDVGQAVASVRTARDLVASITAPRVLVAGDRAVVQGALHNRTAAAVAVRVTARVGADDRRHDAELAAQEERAFPIEVFASSGGGPLQLALIAEGALAAAAEGGLEVVPFGVEQRVGRSGVLSEGARFTLELPARRTFRDASLHIDLAFGATRSLVAAALDSGTLPVNCRRVPQTNAATASRGLAALAVLDHLDRVGGEGARADRNALDAQARSAVAALVAAQRPDGGIAWIGARDGDLRTTAAGLHLFSAAAGRGFAGASTAADRAGDWLITRLRGVRDEDRVEPERALAVGGRGRFESLNALHRRKASLDLDALGRLALAWRALGRAELAGEVDQISAPMLAQPAQADARTLTAVALATRSLLLADPSDPRAARAVEWIDGQRAGAGWATPAATAEAVRTLAIAGGVDLAAAAEGEVAVTVNGREVGRVALRDDQRLPSIDVPADLLRAGGNVVELRLIGRGRVRYTGTLRGFADGFEAADRRDDLVDVRRRYLPALRRIDGAVVQPGFSVVSGPTERFENTMTQLAVGSSGRVETTFFVRGDDGAAPRLAPVIVEEPFPAGCTVPRGSIAGGFEHFEILPDRLVFYYRDGVRSDTVRYELQGRFQGAYRALPTVVRGADRPDLIAYGRPGALEVLARGVAGTGDTYRMTPDELFAFGRAAFEHGDLAAAGEHFEALIGGFALRDDVFRDVAQKMLFVAIRRDDARGIVRWFEVMKDRAPDFVVPFDAIRAVGKAYIDLGEFEAALLVYRATAEASFLKEANVATTLQQLGEVKASVRFLRRLLDTYPDLNTMRQSLYGIAQRLGLLAADMAHGARVDDRVGDRDELRRESIATLREFLVLYPEDPLAEEVSFAWATTLIEAGALQRALEIAEGALARYPDSTLEDEFLYTAGYARFALGRPEPALEAVRRVAVEQFARRDGGGRGPSENRKHAIYLEGQIQHAIGSTAAALDAYDRVSKDFTDAAEAAEFFRRRELTLAEVTRVGSGEPAQLQVTWRNLREVAIKVYRVDLMRLYLLHKSLDNVRDIQLHGIAPFHAEAVALGAGEDHDEHEVRVQLPLTEEGAYLVVARSDDLIASGLVLRSDLRIDAQESLDVGRVRVNVERDGRWVGDAEVKVVGSGDGRIRSGRTDLRGIFVADDVVGRSTVLVRVGDGFAFYRGEGLHQPARMPAPTPQPPVRGQPQGEQEGRKVFNAWENNILLNDSNRRRQIQWLEQEVLEKQQKGVEVFRAK